MARKTMAERYAAQRSRKDARRRSLPRLSDAGTAMLAERDDEDSDDADQQSFMGAARPARDPAVTVARRVPRPDSARRLSPLSRGGITGAPIAMHVDYSYVIRDLRRIAVTAVVMLVLLIALNLIVQSVVR